MRSQATTRLLLSALACLLFCSAAAHGQSGRRGAKSPAVPVPTPEATPTPEKNSGKEKPELTLIVGIDQNSLFSGRATFYFSTVLRACAEGLDDVRTVKVEMAERDMGRGDAIRRAKSEEEAYVVALRLLSENNSINDSNYDNENFYIEYTIFTPKTAALKGSGRTYARAYGRKGGVVVGPQSTGRTSPAYTEYLLKEAARAAAEEILDKLHISSGKVPLPR
jgi:hypothetical protein